MDDPILEIRNMRLVGAHDVGGHDRGGRMGEGIALQRRGRRRIAYLATESGPIGLSVLDVTDPADVGVLARLPAENDHVRFNSLSMSGDILVVARQTQRPGQQPAGLAVYDASDPERLRQLDLALLDE
jgi:hypothetical protein